jgi:ABC-type Fe3+-citrate transport system substrate-binding protein
MPKQTVEARLAQHDREIAAIRKLILQGMKLVVSTQRELRQLAAEQRITEKKLRELLDALGRGGQGNGKARGNGTVQ